MTEKLGGQRLSLDSEARPPAAHICMACTTARLAALLLLCLALGDGGFGRQSAGQQAAAAAAPPGLPCTALVDTDTPDGELAI